MDHSCYCIKNRWKWKSLEARKSEERLILLCFHKFQEGNGCHRELWPNGPAKCGYNELLSLLMTAPWLGISPYFKFESPAGCVFIKIVNDSAIHSDCDDNWHSVSSYEYETLSCLWTLGWFPKHLGWVLLWMKWQWTLLSITSGEHKLYFYWVSTRSEITGW